MKIHYYQDETLNLELDDFCAMINDIGSLNDHSMTVEFDGCQSPINILSRQKFPKEISVSDRLKVSGNDRVIIFTKKKYDDCFSRLDGNIYVISLSFLESQANYIPYKLMRYYTYLLLCDVLNIDKAIHDETSGCVNGFVWGKDAIDYQKLEMYFCSGCKANFHSKTRTDEEKEIFDDLEELLTPSQVLPRVGEAVFEAARERVRLIERKAGLKT